MDLVLSADAEWRRAIGNSAFRSLEGPLAAHLSLLGPLSRPLTRHLWVSTSSPNWTAYFDNGLDGSDPWSAVSFLSERLGCRGILVAGHPSVRRSWSAVTRFDLFGQKPVDELNVTRSIALENEGGRWSWSTTGDPLPFEEIGHYANRRTQDRLPAELVFRYAQALGAPLDSEAFYGPRATLVEHRHVPVHDCRQETHAEARRRVGIR
jgi:hypothetical protein